MSPTCITVSNIAFIWSIPHKSSITTCGRRATVPSFESVCPTDWNRGIAFHPRSSLEPANALTRRFPPRSPAQISPRPSHSAHAGLRSNPPPLIQRRDGTRLHRESQRTSPRPDSRSLSVNTSKYCGHASAIPNRCSSLLSRASILFIAVVSRWPPFAPVPLRAPRYLRSR